MDPLLAACREAPDDDAPRLVWADAVGGERGELVVLQCDLARGGLAPAEAGERRRRERLLLDLHGRAWSELDGIAQRCTFQRGFPELAVVQLDDLPRVVERPLLTSLTLTGASMSVGLDDFDAALETCVARFDAALGAPVFAQLRAFELEQVAVHASSDDDPPQRLYRDLTMPCLERVLAQPWHGALTAFGVSSLDERGQAALLASELDLTSLALGQHQLSTELLRAVLARFPRLDTLSITERMGGAPIAELVDAIPATVRHLAVGALDDRDLVALSRSAIAPHIESLAIELRGSTVLPELAALRSLRVLRLIGFPRRGAPVLPLGELGQLRVLDGSFFDRETILPAMREVGARLERLELAPPIALVAEELASLVAGELASADDTRTPSVDLRPTTIPYGPPVPSRPTRPGKAGYGW